MKKQQKSNQLLKLECKNCGASLKMQDQTHAKCTHCGQIYLIDEIANEIVDVSVDYRDTAAARKAVFISKILLVVFVSLAVSGLSITLYYNIGANISALSSDGEQTEDIGEAMVLFCEDIFGKEYSQITREEFDSIKYLKYSYEDVGNKQNYHMIEYSFTDYQDCDSEDAFQETIQQWTHSSDETRLWVHDLTMFTGLTRIDTTEHRIGPDQMKFAEGNCISYVETAHSQELIAEILAAENIKVLHTEFGGYDSAEVFAQFVNLEELVLSDPVPMGNSVDISSLRECSKLRSLKLDCGVPYTGMEALGTLTQLESLYIDDTQLSECAFLEDLPQLKELYVCSGEEPDLSVLQELSNLEKLYFLDDEKINVQSICMLTNLQELKVRLDSVESLNELTKLKGLKKLHVDINGEGKFIGLENLLNIPKLESLTISGDAIPYPTELLVEKGALQQNANIKKLNLSELVLVDADTGETLDFSFLQNYSKIKELYLYQCGLTNIDFVSELQELEICALIEDSETEIPDYSGLLNCRKLKILYVDSSDDINIALSKDVKIYDIKDYYEGNLP